MAAAYRDTPEGWKLKDIEAHREQIPDEQNAALVITDSGGVQEETTYLRVPCLTVRENTERPVTITMGSNLLIGQNMERLREEVTQVLTQGGKRGQIPPLWDGRASERIVAVVRAWKK